MRTSCGAWSPTSGPLVGVGGVGGILGHGVVAGRVERFEHPMVPGFIPLALASLRLGGAVGHVWAPLSCSYRSLAPPLTPSTPFISMV